MDDPGQVGDSRLSDREGNGVDPHLNEDLCLDLLQGLVPPSEKERLLSHLAVCPSCESLFQARVAERHHLRATRVLRSLPSGGVGVERTVAATAGEELREHEPRYAPLLALREMWRRIASAAQWAALQWKAVGHWVALPGWRAPAAAGLVVGAGVVLVLFLRTGQREGSERESLRWLPTSSSAMELRSVAEGLGDTEVAAGLLAYSARDLGQAIEHLRRSEATGEIGMLRDVFLGSALAMEGRFSEAVLVLKRVPVHTLPDPWGSEAAWTLSVALRGAGRESSADSILRVLAEEPDEIGERARQQLGRQKVD